nr:phosphatase PAP2 family protein [Salsipaludibacter albus]
MIVHPPAGSSWPSGHTAVASAIATIVADSGPAGSWSGLVSALWVGWSRTYVGAHHPSDIVAGLGVGALSAIAWRRLLDRFRDPDRPQG